MNYRGRVMELDIGWSGAELRCMAAEMAAEADAEIARLREALDVEVRRSNARAVDVASLRYVLAHMGDMAKARELSYELAQKMVSAALAQVAEVGK